MLVWVGVGRTMMGVVLPLWVLWRFPLRLFATTWYWKCVGVSCH